MEERNAMKQLESINKKYLQMKAELQAKKPIIENKQKELEEKEEDLKVADAVIVLKKRKGLTAEVEKAKKDKENIKKEIKTIKEELENEKQNISKLTKGIEEILENLKENEELRKYIEECIAKRYKRENKELRRDKMKEEEKRKKSIEGLEKAKNTLEKIKKIQEDSFIKANLKRMFQAKQIVKELEEKLEKLDEKDPANKDEIEAIKAEIATKTERAERNKEAILGYFEKNKLDITETDLEEIEKTVMVYEGIVDIDATLSVRAQTYELVATKINDTIKKSDKKIRNYDKRIRINEKAIERCEVNEVKNEDGQKQMQESDDEISDQMQEDDIDLTSSEPVVGDEGQTINKSSTVDNGKIFNDHPENDDIREEEPQKKLNFFQKIFQKFFKRKALPEPVVKSRLSSNLDTEPELGVDGEEEPVTIEEDVLKKQESEAKKESYINEFQNSLKYDVVREMAEKLQNDKRREVRKEVKEEMKAEKESEER